MKTVLITGGAGYIGAKLAQQLQWQVNYNVSCGQLPKKYKVIVADNLMYDQGPFVFQSLQNVQFVKADVTQLKGKLLELVQAADVVIPLAAIVGAPACDKNPGFARKVNLDAVSNLISVLREDQLVIFPNTNSGYGKAKDTVCTEETPLNPISLYGQLKDEAEYVVRKHPNHVVFRLATVFGYSPRHRLDLLVNTLVHEAVTKGVVEIFDDSFMRNYIHIDDICSAFSYAIENEALRNNVYNLGNDSLNMSKGDLLDVIGKYLLFETRKISKTDPDQRDYVVSSEKLYKTGWQPNKSLKDGIVELIRFYSVLPNNPSLLGYMKNV